MDPSPHSIVITCPANVLLWEIAPHCTCILTAQKCTSWFWGRHFDQKRTIFFDSFFHAYTNWINKHTISYHFTCLLLFICGGPHHLSSFMQCSEDLIILREQLVYSVCYCRYWKFDFLLQNYTVLFCRSVINYTHFSSLELQCRNMADAPLITTVPEYKCSPLNLGKNRVTVDSSQNTHWLGKNSSFK